MRAALGVGLLCGLLLAACSGGTPVEDAGSIDDAGAVGDAGLGACGTMTCGASEYCVVTCTCCGVPGGGTPSATYECRTFSRSCDSSNMCACAEIADLGGLCDQEHERVEIPCA